VLEPGRDALGAPPLGQHHGVAAGQFVGQRDRLAPELDLAQEPVDLQAVGRPRGGVAAPVGARWPRPRCSIAWPMTQAHSAGSRLARWLQAIQPLVVTRA
jgi:hypothetical protein